MVGGGREGKRSMKGNGDLELRLMGFMDEWGRRGEGKDEEEERSSIICSRVLE